jgi:hypothetical protein
MTRYMFYAGSYTDQFHIMEESLELAILGLEKYLRSMDIEQCKKSLESYGITKEFKFPNTIIYPSGRTVYFLNVDDWVEKEGFYTKQFKGLCKPESIFEFEVGEVSQTEVA